ncbi:MAG: DegT/DnrJ/EryC1/StrS family aminotransferase [Pirellulales bacterium]|nr:DegT/DnrJ/EryC1/StrS family aminotransferase [Pirellulales bacterium]
MTTKNNRRKFMKTTGAAAASLYVAGTSKARAAAKKETLAINGGPKSVTIRGDTRWPRFGKAECDEVAKLIMSPSYAPIDVFEKAWKDHFKCAYAKAHCNGTSALGACMFALDLPVGSEILVPSYSTWFPLSPARLVGIVPKFVDIDPMTLNIDVEDCKRKLTSKTRAILPVHWWGLPCEMDHVCDFAKEKGLEVVEDASHAHGSVMKGVNIGNWGRMAGFSLQGSKPLPSIEGGIANFKNRLDYERATTFGFYGLPGKFPKDSPYRKYDKTAFGSKLRMHPASAIMARHRLAALDEQNAVINKMVRAINDKITQLPGLDEPTCRKDTQRVYYNSNMLILDKKKAGAERKAIIKALAAEGVSASIFGWKLLHTYPYFQEAKWWHHQPAAPGKLPGCDRANQTTIDLPLFRSDQPELAEQYVKAFEKVWANMDKLG